MGTFIRVNSEVAVNADSIRKIDIKDGKATLRDGGGDLLGVITAQQFESVPASYLPVTGGWDCLSYFAGEDGKYQLIVEPVIAWGITLSGDVRPVRPSDGPAPDALWRYLGLRRPGSAEVYSYMPGDENSPYPSIEEWSKATADALDKLPKL